MNDDDDEKHVPMEKKHSLIFPNVLNNDNNSHF